MYEFADDKLTIENDAKAMEREAGAVVEGGQEEVSDVLAERAAEMRPVSEFSMELMGKSHPDALYRAAGGLGMSGVDRLGVGGGGGGLVFGCPCCGRTVGRVVRVRATRESAWRAVCAMCAAAALEKYPDAVVGGLVRAGRRKRVDRRGLRDAG